MRLIPDPRYLEVGVWAGSTLCSAIAGNGVRAVAIDNWSKFGGPRERCLENLTRFGTISDVRLVECDFRKVPFEDQGRFNVYLYDGPHSAEDQYDGLVLALPSLDAEFVFIADDWNWAEVRKGTRSAIERLGLEIVYAIEVRTTTNDSHPPHCGFDAKETDWHNGYFIAVLKKQVEPGPTPLRFGNALASVWKRIDKQREAFRARRNAKYYASNPTNCEVLALITHHYVPERLQWLGEVLQGLAHLDVRRTHALIITNTADPHSLGAVRNAAMSHATDAFSTEVVTSPPLLHPHDLPWVQKPLITARFLGRGSRFTHVISLEDDIAFGREGLRYWLEHRPLLCAHGLIPSFMRVETRPGDPVVYATDALAPNSLEEVRAGSYRFIALDNPYCAMFVLDRALAREYAASPSFHMGASMSVSVWRTRARAAMGLCWNDPPAGFAARHVAPVDETTMSIAPCAHVRHLPGNYASDPTTPHGKLPVGAVLAL
ncbi:MAG: class I SAM-dependent methyltransferase [Acetobacteraceae bacterium]|nr:class I SAM-dependent methyltransferase [Acetobacteraceae bacterium]